MYDKIVETLENNCDLYYKIKNKEEAIRIANELIWNDYLIFKKDFVDSFDAGNDCFMLYGKDDYERNYLLINEDCASEEKIKYEPTETIINPTYDDLLPLFSDTEPKDIDDVNLNIVFEYDTVEKPEHYNVFEREVIYVIKDLLDNNENHSGFKSYCIGNSLKYIFRAGLKGDYYEDLEKARYYINKILEGRGSR